MHPQISKMTLLGKVILCQSYFHFIHAQKARQIIFFYWDKVHFSEVCNVNEGVSVQTDSFI